MVLPAFQETSWPLNGTPGVESGMASMGPLWLLMLGHFRDTTPIWVNSPTYFSKARGTPHCRSRTYARLPLGSHPARRSGLTGSARAA
eukprot:9094042-Pyramimonas_sp.AAC.1